MSASDGDLRAVVEAFDPTRELAAASTPPAAWYTRADLAALERDAVFVGSWQRAARADELSAPGAYRSGHGAAGPWVVVRGHDGVLRAFANVCRHKATGVVTGGGCLGADEVLTCPYHGWSYGLDGRLKTAPGLGRTTGFDRDAMGLDPLAVETWGPLVFVNDDASASSLAGAVPELDAAFGATGWTDLTWVSSRTWDLACNWKVFCDNYLDGGYHIAHLHASLDDQLDMASYRTEVHARSSLQTSRAADAGPGRRIGPGALYGFVYPNLMLNRYGSVLDTNLVIPLAPDRCRVVFDFWFEQTEGPEAQAAIAASLAQSQLTQDEDVAISESVQLGLESGHYDRGPYGRPETGVLHFHRLLAADLRAGLTRAST